MKEMIFNKPDSILLHSKRLFILSHVSRFNTMVNPYFVWIHGKFFILRNIQARLAKLVLLNNRNFSLNQYSISHINLYPDISFFIKNNLILNRQVIDANNKSNIKNINNISSLYNNINLYNKQGLYKDYLLYKNSAEYNKKYLNNKTAVSNYRKEDVFIRENNREQVFFNKSFLTHIADIHKSHESNWNYENFTEYITASINSKITDIYNNAKIIVERSPLSQEIINKKTIITFNKNYHVNNSMIQPYFNNRTESNNAKVYNKTVHPFRENNINGHESSIVHNNAYNNLFYSQSNLYKSKSENYASDIKNISQKKNVQNIFINNEKQNFIYKSFDKLVKAHAFLKSNNLYSKSYLYNKNNREETTSFNNSISKKIENNQSKIIYNNANSNLFSIQTHNLTDLEYNVNKIDDIFQKEKKENIKNNSRGITLFNNIISKKIEDRDNKKKSILNSYVVRNIGLTNINNSIEQGFERFKNDSEKGILPLDHFNHSSIDKDFIEKKLSYSYEQLYHKNMNDVYANEETETKKNSSSFLNHIKPAQETLHDLKNSVDTIKKQLEQQGISLDKKQHTDNAASYAMPGYLNFNHQNLELLTDKVYRLLERKIMVERERRGIRC